MYVALKRAVVVLSVDTQSKHVLPGFCGPTGCPWA